MIQHIGFLPINPYVREHIQNWVAVKLKWEATADAKEIAVLREILGAEAELSLGAIEWSGTITLFSAK